MGWLILSVLTVIAGVVLMVYAENEDKIEGLLYDALFFFGKIMKYGGLVSTVICLIEWIK